MGLRMTKMFNNWIRCKTSPTRVNICTPLFCTYTAVFSVCSAERVSPDDHKHTAARQATHWSSCLGTAWAMPGAGRDCLSARGFAFCWSCALPVIYSVHARHPLLSSVCGIDTAGRYGRRSGHISSWTIFSNLETVIDGAVEEAEHCSWPRTRVMPLLSVFLPWRTQRKWGISNPSESTESTHWCQGQQPSVLSAASSVGMWGFPKPSEEANTKTLSHRINSL